MALDLLNVGDSRATTKAKLDAAFAEVGLPASGNTTEATDTFNEMVADYLVDPLPGLTDGMAGDTARSRINAAITALNVPGTINLFGSGTARLRAALAATKAGSTDTDLAFVGTSLTVGVGADGATGAIRALSMPTKVGEGLDDLIPVNFGSWWGGHTLSAASWPTYDPRVSLGEGWGFTSSGLTGSPFTQSTPNAGNLVFSPDENIDRVDVWYPRLASGLGAFTYNFDAEAASAEVTQIGAVALLKQTASISGAADRSFSLRRSSGNASYLTGIKAYNSTVKALNIMNMGYGGSTSATWNDSANVIRPKTAVASIAPHAVLLALGANDYVSLVVPVATYKANMQALIDAWSPKSDVILAVEPPGPVTRQTTENQQLYRAALYELAQENGLALIDAWHIYGTAEANPTYYAQAYAGDIHQTAAGYAFWGGWIAEVLRRLI